MWSWLLAVVFVGSAYCQPACRTPNDQSGYCVPVADCAPLTALLNQNPRLPEATIFLQQSRCRNQQLFLYVCCPENIFSFPIFPQQPVYNHSSLQLLPLESCGFQETTKLIPGNITELNDFPWITLLKYKSLENGSIDFKCVGSLINKRYVVTAASCISDDELENYKLISVILGEWNLATDPDCTYLPDDGKLCAVKHTELEVEEAISHPYFYSNMSNQFNDIALLRLSDDAPLNNEFIGTICLPIYDDENKKYEGQRVTVSGWGKKTENGALSPVKLQAWTRVVGIDFCQDAYKSWDRRIVESQICAGGESRLASCAGDTGAPLMLEEAGKSRLFLIGVSSFGPRNCDSGIYPGTYPGVFTKITPFLPWILDNIKD